MENITNKYPYLFELGMCLPNGSSISAPLIIDSSVEFSESALIDVDESEWSKVESLLTQKGGLFEGSKLFNNFGVMTFKSAQDWDGHPNIRISFVKSIEEECIDEALYTNPLVIKHN